MKSFQISLLALISSAAVIVALIFIGLMFFAMGARAETVPLETQMRGLEVRDSVPSGKVREDLYAVQPRATPLAGRWEALLGVGQNFTGSGFLTTRQVNVEAQYHFDNRWAVAGAYSWVNNEFSSSAKSLRQAEGMYPDIDYAIRRMEARAQFNLFYGKFRFSKRQAMSFDQYVGLGPAMQELRSGSTVGLVADVGFAFWFGSRVSVHVGAKDYYYKENRTLSQGYGHNVHGYLQTGILF